MIRYCLHPNWVNSKEDGNRHFVGYLQLAQLYGVKTGEYVVNWPDGEWEIRHRLNAQSKVTIRCLGPRSDGHYVRVEG